MFTILTAGHRGRPSWACWHVSVLENSQKHGLGSQQKYDPDEADANLGTDTQGVYDTVSRIQKVMMRDTFLNEKKY